MHMPQLLTRTEGDAAAQRRFGRRYCGAYTLRGRHLSGRKTVYSRLHCRCWKCARCGPKRAAQYKHAISEIAERLRLTRFVTLTLDPAKIDGPAVPYLRECFSKFRVYLRRKYGESPQYIAVLEFQ